MEEHYTGITGMASSASRQGYGLAYFRPDGADKIGMGCQPCQLYV